MGNLTKLKVSVIVPTFNGAKKIPFLLNALKVQSYKDFELVIVIDGSTDNTSEVLKPFMLEFDTIRVITQANGGRANVRNRGANEAAGDIIIFYDDDMVPNQNSVQLHVAFHEVNPKIVLCGNPAEYPDISKTDIQNYKAWLCQKWTEKYKYGLTRLSKAGYFLTAANMSVSKVVFRELNGFQNGLTDSEDLDFATRALSIDIPLFFDKSNIAIHNDPITCLSYINRIREYAAANEKLKAFDAPVTLESPKSMSRFLKTTIYRLFAFKFWQEIIDTNKLVYWLPRPVRFRLYDLVIQSLGREFKNVNLG
jgi:glycosyltransferase involved in cell wall biosynthesis